MGIIQELKDKIADLQVQIGQIQEECSHPASVVTKVHESNTGNYDPSADCYWTNFHCGLCEKRWQEAGSK